MEEKTIPNKGALYKPALKLIGKTTSTPNTSPIVNKSLIGSVKKEPSMHTESTLNSSINSALETEKTARVKKQAEEKKKSNLELFKEELKK